MIRSRRLLWSFSILRFHLRRSSLVAEKPRLKRESVGRVYHPDDRSSSVSALILAEQAWSERLPSTDIKEQDTRYVSTKYQHIPTEENQYLKLAEAITPLWNVPYKKQLNPKWKGYRNKDEFVVHVGVNRYTPTVGFCLGNSRDLDKSVCVGPDHLTNVKLEHKEVAKLFEEYIQMSTLPVTENLTKNHWRKLLVRSNHKGEILMLATMHPQNLTQAEVDQEKQKLVHFFTEGPHSDLDLRSLYFQTYEDNGTAPYQLLWGDPYLEEIQGDLKLRVCPQTSLLENSSVADTLYKTIAELAELKPETTILDVNCGAGALSLHLARLTTRMIGVKRSHGKIADVYYNAQSNGIHNASFTQKELPDFLRQLRRHNFSDLVAVINPSKHFLNRHSVIFMKNVKSLRRIVYITDSLEGQALKNIMLFCQSYGRDHDGTQFFPVKAVPIDVYPQTNSYYFVIVLDRFAGS